MPSTSECATFLMVFIASRFSPEKMHTDYVNSWKTMTEQSTGSTQPDALANTLSERGSRYGAFKGHAEVSQELKEVVWRALLLREKSLEPDQSEALEMIMHKIGRIINGDANYLDNWVDIAGYAMLVHDRLLRG